MSKKEAAARLKINKMLEESGWRLLDEDNLRANVDVETRLSPGKKIDPTQMGDDFNEAQGGFIDYLLLDDNQKPIAVLEAKRESKSPLDGKEQAREYANRTHVRYVILSNGNVHYLWDMIEGNPEPILKLPTQESLTESKRYQPNPGALSDEKVDDTYIAHSQIPDFDKSPQYLAGGDTRQNYMRDNKLKIMRKYQVGAIHAIQNAAKEGNKRYLLEMATGTGKTLTCAAIIKLFLKTGNAKRVLFLVDRIELEKQAQEAFENSLGSDFTVYTYKEHKDDWGTADIVVSTVQSLQTNDKYKKEFSPTDFELVISDEAHRSIGGNARAVFEYFVGYRVGLTATPKDYLKNVTNDDQNTLKDFERRQLLDTYTTFGCDSGQPTFSYSLLDGVNDPDGPYLVNPIIIDARTDITTRLLSAEGYAVHKVIDEETEVDAIFGARDFERKFFNEKTNQVLAQTFLDNADADPISGELGKSIVFAVSQPHAAKMTNILNRLAMARWPGKYQSDFAVQITSNVADAQEYTTKFSNNNLRGKTNWLDNYDSSRTRVVITVGMMTTGYDCSDLLNVAFMRPVFSPSDFIQMKGRGTRLHNFRYIDYTDDENLITAQKNNFKLIDFFAVCEYFDEKYDYEAELAVPKKIEGVTTGYAPPVVDGSDIVSEPGGSYAHGVDLDELDKLKSQTTTVVDGQGMRIDREMFRKFKEELQSDEEFTYLYDTNRDEALDYLKNKIFDKPNHFMNLEKIRNFFKLDRKLSLGEALDIVMDQIDQPKSKAEIIHDKFNDAVITKELTDKLTNDNIFHLAYRLFDAYISSPAVQKAVDDQTYGNLDHTSQLSLEEYIQLHHAGVAEPLVNYIKDYVDITKLRG
ncbi:MAG TPA: DEAD/DEAH box helicase family protein [Candidatus Saccharimonadales bacterium]